ncbi:MAG: hypothetical protein D6691_07765 [Candidatus Hydrogenedentota bacterium]|nr:S26 family signal peptidase [Candidatus Sumerlaea chitinivorans]RMH26578.1 MAG: hypothetical protein D6691_07765 [Candidatus Hydrogenedentota bacterium]GIX44254.1 MAG: hypothetical protein KatS3mg130_0662 [Candidatus Sumerlaea sp.]
MRVCPVCSFRNPETNQRCAKCQALLVDDETVWQESLRRSRHATLSALTYRVAGLVQRGWASLPFRNWWDIPPAVQHRFPALAGFLSLIPGAGQIYNRQYAKAILFAVLWSTLAATGWVTIREWYSNYLLFGLLGVHLLIITDAVATAIRANGQFWSFRNTIALWFAILFYAGVVITAAQYLLPAIFVVLSTVALSVLGAYTEFSGKRLLAMPVVILAIVAVVVGAYVISRPHSARIFAFVRLTKPVGGSILRKGDLLLVDYRAYWFARPSLGEIVHFDPPPFRLQHNKDEYLVNIMDYFQRVAGMPGDRIEKRNGIFYRNGNRMPDGLIPWGGERIPDWTFDVPEKHYFVPVTKIPDDVLTSLMGSLTGGSAQMPELFAPGWLFIGWKEATMVPSDQIYGRVLAIVNPPERRRWLFSSGE